MSQVIGMAQRPFSGPPESGPRILFFSGGTALRGMSRELIRHTHNSVHVITPFDSGGSSAVLRDAFAMPAVGDIRNRLLALTDLTVRGMPEIFALFTYRLSRGDPAPMLAYELRRMAAGEHVLTNLVPQPQRDVICDHFRTFIELMPNGFDLRGASVGNIVLTAGYLSHGRRFGPAIDHFSDLAQVRGVVRPVVDADLHLAAELADGSVVVGQHRLTGKEVHPLAAKVTRLWLTNSLDSRGEVRIPVDGGVRDLIARADLICFPIGSFYTSLVANLLPDGVGAAVAANPCPKVFVPNPVGDPELIGHTVADQVRVLQRVLTDSGAPPGQDVIQRVLVDSRAEYPGGLDVAQIEALGVTVTDTPFVADDSAPYFSSKRLAERLLSLTD